jgi:hypothetical protein
LRGPERGAWAAVILGEQELSRPGGEMAARKQQLDGG